MTQLKKLLIAFLFALLPVANGALADDKATVQTFYDFLSNPGSAAAAKAFKLYTPENWESIGDYSGKN